MSGNSISRSPTQPRPNGQSAAAISAAGITQTPISGTDNRFAISP
jgi:hypothetical protein